MSSQPPPPTPELEDELAAFRREWQEETKRRQPLPSTAGTSTKIPPRDQPPQQPQQPIPTSPKGKSTGLNWLETVQQQLDDVKLVETQIEDRPEPIKEKERERPKSALDLYSEAVKSEQEGRLNDGKLFVSLLLDVRILPSYLIARILWENSSSQLSFCISTRS